MTQPRIMLATLCINEMEWLAKLYAQHRDWPGLVSWCFVEAADRAYATANPEMVSKDHLSVDGTTEFLRGLVDRDPRVSYVGYGLSRHADVAQGKAPARTQYMRLADSVKPDWVVILDADEFYPKDSQERISEYLSHAHVKDCEGVCFRQREIWRPPSLTAAGLWPLFTYEVVGGLWKMHHCHCWRWRWGLQYSRSHVWPETQQGVMLNRSMARADRDASSPEWVHLGWASQAKMRLAKTRYYTARGEGVRDGRHRWMACRYAWESWKPGDILPYGAAVVPYAGPIPEVFR